MSDRLETRLLARENSARLTEDGPSIDKRILRRLRDDSDISHAAGNTSLTFGHAFVLPSLILTDDIDAHSVLILAEIRDFRAETAR